MKKYAAFIVILVSIFLASQAFSQVESKTEGTKTTEKKSDTKTGEKTVPAVQSTKTGPGTTNTSKEGTSDKSQQGTVSSAKPVKTGSMFDAGGELIYSYDQMGYVRNAKNRVYFQFTPKGEIIRKRAVVGSVSKGSFQDRVGKEYARFVHEGKVVDANSKSVEQVKEDGTVLDKNGTKIGSAPGVDKNVVVIVYFFKEVLDTKGSKTKP